MRVPESAMNFVRGQRFRADTSSPFTPLLHLARKAPPWLCKGFPTTEAPKHVPKIQDRSIEALASQRGDTIALLAEKVSARQRELEAEMAKNAVLNERKTPKPARSDTPTFGERSKRKKRSSRDTRPAQDGGAMSAPNNAPEFLRLRRLHEHSQ